jgi:hypothetical protein
MADEMFTGSNSFLVDAFGSLETRLPLPRVRHLQEQLFLTKTHSELFTYIRGLSSNDQRRDALERSEALLGFLIDGGIVSVVAKKDSQDNIVPWRDERGALVTHRIKTIHQEYENSLYNGCYEIAFHVTHDSDGGVYMPAGEEAVHGPAVYNVIGADTREGLALFKEELAKVSGNDEMAQIIVPRLFHDLAARNHAIHLLSIDQDITSEGR